MTDNLAYQEDWRTETHDGKIIYMSPRPQSSTTALASILRVLSAIILRGKSCDVFSNGTDVHLTEKDRVVPDIIIVCNRR